MADVAERGWKRRFVEPIPLPRGRQIVTLRDAADYITGLPKKESDLPNGKRQSRCCCCAAAVVRR